MPVFSFCLPETESDKEYCQVCQVCRDYDWNKLVPCKTCGFVYTCDKRHFRKDHNKWCKILKSYSDVAASKRNSITEEFKNRFKVDAIDEPSSMNEVLVKGLTWKDQSPESNVDKILLSELLTYPLTVFNSLRQIKGTNQPEVTVIFVGAEAQAEVEPTEKWEKYLLHFLPAVKVLNLIFLGPELQTPMGDDVERREEMCDECRRQNKKVRYELACGQLYHEYSSKTNPKVDLICAMNSGMYRSCGFDGEDSWRETMVRLFVQQPAPVLVTEYTSCELKKDLDKVKNLCGKSKQIVQMGMNPFASLKPGLNVISESETPVIFKNYYSVILKPKMK